MFSLLFHLKYTSVYAIILSLRFLLFSCMWYCGDRVHAANPGDIFVWIREMYYLCNCHSVLLNILYVIYIAFGFLHAFILFLSWLLLSVWKHAFITFCCFSLTANLIYRRYVIIFFIVSFSFKFFIRKASLRLWFFCWKLQCVTTTTYEVQKIRVRNLLRVHMYIVQYLVNGKIA